MKKLILTLATVSCLVSCNNKDKHDALVQRARQAAIDSVEYANKQQRRIDSLEALTRTAPASTLIGLDHPAMVPLSEAPKRSTKKHTPVRSTSPSGTTPQTTSNQPQTQTSGAGNATVAPSTNGTAATPAPEKKKGLNNSAKGAIIGLGTGAAAGAIIGKENRGKGAIIGGVVGAIGGAVGGAVLDKRKSKKAAEAAKADSLRQDSIRRAQ